MLTQQIPKTELQQFFQELPEMVNVEDVMYRLYMFQKIQEGERDIQSGRIVQHNQVVERLSRKWQQ